jgi:uncharacterized membrane protein YozB (DUF420 family)
MVSAYSTAVLVLIFSGLAVRRRRRAHIPVMLSAFVLDMASVVWLQVQRRAVQTAVNEMTPILAVHVGLAVGTILLYLFMIATGWRLAARDAGRGAHRAGAVLFLACRVGTWATSFFVD